MRVFLQDEHETQMCNQNRYEMQNELTYHYCYCKIAIEGEGFGTIYVMLYIHSALVTQRSCCATCFKLSALV